MTDSRWNRLIGGLAASILVQSAALTLLGRVYGIEPAAAAVMSTLTGILVAVGHPLRRSVYEVLVYPGAIASVGALVSLIALSPEQVSAALLAGIWLLTATLAALAIPGADKDGVGGLAGVHIVLGLCVAPLVLAPLFSPAAVGDGYGFAALLLALSPVCVLSALIGYDLFYSAWVYANTPFADLRLDGVNLVISVSAYLSAATIACTALYNANRTNRRKRLKV